MSKIKHTQLNRRDLPKAIEQTNTFKGFETFKKGLTLRSQNIDKIHDYYMQACRHGIEYLRQNQVILANDVKIIEEILNT